MSRLRPLGSLVFQTLRGVVGYTLIELVITMTLAAILASLLFPVVAETLVQQKVNRAVIDLRAIDDSIHQHLTDYADAPVSLEDVGFADARDPWGWPYQYLPRLDPNWLGESRKDRFLVPLNQDYDLYSLGPDGESEAPLTAPVSHDDIIRAADGGYFGPADEF